MADLITEYASYDSFVREYHSKTLTDHDLSLEEVRKRGLLNERTTRKLWRLLGRLDSEELLVQIPEWLAEKKCEFTESATPTMFVGYISRETEAAILFKGSTAARPLMERAHRIHALESGIENTRAETDRHERLANRLEDHYRAFCDRDDLPSLSEEWLPKSQLVAAVRRRG